MLSASYIFSLLALAASTVVAQADFTCSSDASCPAWYNASDHAISPNSTCVGDPMMPQYGYCGWVGASCGTSDDCDYGQCISGRCYGYYGATCKTQNDCLGTLPCSSGTCGGAGGGCPNGNTDCASQNCVNGACAALAVSKLAVGMGCQDGSICGSGICGSDFTCAVSNAAPAVGASQGARHRARRDAHSHGRPRSNFNKRRCPKVGQTACLMGISSGSGLAYECVDTTSSLESCGGCLPVPGSNDTVASDPSAPAGVDCTALPNVEEVVCQSSRCKIIACLPGSTLDPDGTACRLV